MPLPSPPLDNRRFQDIVDEAKGLIPRYCPEWTDHNVSDPGIAMIELFAWMTEMLLYRVNQVPEKCYLKFLELIGVKLQAPAAATAAVTFYLSAPQATEVVVPRGTETASTRTENTPAVIFTTEADLFIRPSRVVAAYTHSAVRGKDGWVHHDLSRLASAEHSITLFPNPPMPNDAFYLALDADHSNHVLSLAVGCRHAGGAGVDPNNPPIEWEVWQTEARRWVSCFVESDTTRGFNADGEITLHLPKMTEGEFSQRRAYWLRCRLTSAQSTPPNYEVSPVFQRYLRVDSVGGTISARHAVTAVNELLGYSDGTPGQVFKLLNTPVLSRSDATDYLLVEPPDGTSSKWQEVPDFGGSSETDQHYTLDELDGTITFGPALIQPSGSVYRFGDVPPKGSAIRFSRYQHGGGKQGNVPAGAIAVLKSSIPYIASVNNRDRAVGGRDAQSLDDAKLRAARQLRSRTRAVTAEDFEFHACQMSGIARARCLSPGVQPGPASAIPPGQVFVIVLPEIESTARPQPHELLLTEGLRTKALKHLSARSVIGTAVEVRMAEITCVSVNAELHLREGIDHAVVQEVLRASEECLYKYLNPYIGGSEEKGWPFGRSLYLSEIYALLQRVPYVEFVEAVNVYVSEPGEWTPSKPAPPSLHLPQYGVICSGTNRITQANRQARTATFTQ
jgi:predicted phage baseplate assembly protein